MLDDALDPYDAPTRAIVARHRNTSSGTVDQMSKDEDASVPAAIAGRADLGSELRALLVHDQDPAVRTAVADTSVRAAVAVNPASPEWITHQFSEGSDERVRRAMASDHHLPARVLTAMLDGADEPLRRRIAQNPATEPADLRALAEDPSGFVRFLVAGNPATPPEALRILAGNTDTDVRRRVAEHDAR